MATARDDAYSTTGGTIYAGRSAPAGLTIGDHDLRADRHTESQALMDLTINTNATGSSFVAFALGNLPDMGDVSDNKSNTFTKTDEGYYYNNLWGQFGIRTYVAANGAGGVGHTIEFSKITNQDWEADLAIAEVVGALVLQDHNVVARQAAGAGIDYLSGDVTTTGPAMLISCWTGDSDINPDTAAYPQDGWQMLDNYFPTSAYIQIAVAYKYVSVAGTYNCPWRPDINQGAAIAIVALQAS